MAQTPEPRPAAILKAPVTVTFRTTPCVWKIRPAKNVTVIVNGQRVNPMRFYAKAGDWLKGIYLDPWSARDRFLSLRTEKELLGFLNETGFFSVKYGKGKGFWEYRDFQAWQLVMREFLRRPPAKWVKWLGSLTFDARMIVRALQLHEDLRVRFWWKGTKHFAGILAEDSLTAILATIYVDHLRGAKFRFCARHDCRKPFELVSKHRRRYCSQYCAHFQSLRRLRAKKTAGEEDS
ncbi:MAG TPA: hypothetical protein VGQ94_04870 [Terriglobales bacterium]|nr:hypothetical protein [Terriglobales bacterium]